MFLLIMVVFSLYIAKGLFIPVSVGILLSFLLMPVSRWLEQRKTPRILAILLSILLMILVLSGLIFFLSSQFLSFNDELPFLTEKLKEKFAMIQGFVSGNFNISEQYQIEWLETQLANTLASSGKIFGNIFNATGTFLATATLIPIYIFFFTYYRHKLINFVKQLTPPDKHDWILEVMHSTSKVSQKYLVGLLIDISILSVLNSAGFLLLGINHAILLGVVAAILNIIPYIGVLIGSIFPIAMALITKDSIWFAIGALGVCVLVQFLDNNFITPNIVGSAVSINPLATLVVLLIGGMIWGLAGMMLFIPFLGMLKVVLDNVESLRPYGYLIGEEQNFRKKKVKFFKIKF